LPEYKPATTSKIRSTVCPKGVAPSTVILNTAFEVAPTLIIPKGEDEVFTVIYGLVLERYPVAEGELLWPSLVVSIIMSTVSPGSSLPSLFPKAESSIVKSPISKTGALTTILK